MTELPKLSLRSCEVFHCFHLWQTEPLKCDISILIWWIMMTLFYTCCLRICFTDFKKWSLPKLLSTLFSLYSCKKWDREMKQLAEVHIAGGRIKIFDLLILVIQFYTLKLFFLQIQASFTMKQLRKHITIRQYCLDELFLKTWFLFNL